MANITILQEPATIQPAYNDLIYVVSSHNYAQDNFKYIADVTINGEVFRLKVFPDINYNTGIFDFQRIIRNYVTQDIDKSTYGFQENLNSQIVYNIEFGEEYGLSSSGVTAYPNQVTSSNTLAWNGVVDFLPFANYDKDTYVMASGNTTNYLNSLPSSAIIRTSEDAWLYALNETSGTIYYANITTYDSTGATLQMLRVANPYQAITSTNSKYIRFSSGTSNLNLIPSSGITGDDVTLDDNIISFYNADNDATDELSINDGTGVGITYVAGKINQAFHFDAVNDRVDITDGAFDYTTFSVSFWFNADNIAAQGGIFNNYINTGVEGIIIWLKDSKVEFLIGAGAATRLKSSALSSTTWYHVVVTRTAGTRSRIYIDGVLDNSNTNANDPTFTGVKTNLGAIFSTGSTYTDYFGGLVDMVGVWDRELTQEDITALYNSGAGAQYPLPFTGDIITSDVSKYDITFEMEDGTDVSNKQTYLVDNACTDNTVYRLHWLNELGGYDSFSFIRASKQRVGITRSDYNKNIGTSSATGYGYIAKDRSKTSYNTKVDQVITIQSDWIDEATNNSLEELLSSPDVYLDDATYGLVPINILDNSFDLKQDLTDRLWNISITFEYSFDKYRQTR